MKVLYTVDNVWQDHNAYVRVFIKQISFMRKDILLDYGIRKFWNDEAFSFDIIHIMWPHFLLLLGNRTERKTADELEARLRSWRQAALLSSQPAIISPRITAVTATPGKHIISYTTIAERFFISAATA